MATLRLSRTDSEEHRPGASSRLHHLELTMAKKTGDKKGATDKKNVAVKKGERIDDKAAAVRLSLTPSHFQVPSSAALTCLLCVVPLHLRCITIRWNRQRAERIREL